MGRPGESGQHPTGAVIRVANPRGDSMTQSTNKTEPRAHVPALHLVDIATVADYLGVNVRYVRRLVANREIPYIKWRHLLRFDLAVVARRVDQSRYGEERLADRRPTARP